MTSIKSASIKSAPIKSVCVFCASSDGDPSLHAPIEELGRLLANAQMKLVYGGSNVGLMRRVADTVLGAGGEVEGVIPKKLIELEIAHTGLTKQNYVNTMHERKQLMLDLSDAIIVLPGGFGTFDEMFEVMTWKYLGIHNKKIIVANFNGFWDGLFAFFKSIKPFAVLRDSHLATFSVASTPKDIMKLLTE